MTADAREEPSGVPRLLAELGITVDRRMLWAGDYEVGGAIIERKTVRGLHAAVTKGTFWPQLGRVREIAKFPYLLIEGRSLDDGPLTPTAVRGICLALMDLGVGVVRSTSVKDSALWLHRLAERRSGVRHASRPAYAQRPKRSAGAPAAEAALSAVPGISEVSAKALLDHFGTLAAVVQGSSDEWQRVPGIGPSRARAMNTTFHTPTTASGS